MLALRRRAKHLKPLVGCELDLSHDMSNGLVYRTLMNEGGGAKTFDLLGNNSGDFVGGVTWSGGKDGPALTFNGTTGYTEKVVSNFRSSDSSGTIIVRFKTSAPTGYLLASADTATISFYIAAFVLSGALAFQQSNADTPDTLTTVATTFSDGQWHTAAIVSTGTEYSIYVDGVLQALTILSGANTGDWFADTPNRDNIIVGAVKRTTVATYLNGQISDILVYNRPLNATEILYTDPYANILQPTRRRYFFVASAGSIITPRRMMSGIGA